jgi:hypothetical protein
MPDGTIKKASPMVAELLFKNGGREIELKPIELNYGTQRERSIGTVEVPKPKRRRNSGGGEGKVHSSVDKVRGTIL